MRAERPVGVKTPTASHHSLAVIAHPGDGAGAMGAMGMHVHRVSVAVEGVEAMYVVEHTVLVIVHTVAGNFPRIGPNVVAQVGMIVVYSGIDHGHNRCIGAAGVNSPNSQLFKL